MSKKSRANLELYAYTDESGNTGENLFDEAQPVFWTGTLLSKKDLNIDGASLVRECQILLGVQELHGKELGF